jgi:hypothetical protein
MKLMVRQQNGRFEVDPVNLTGSPKVGRGATLLEALGDFLILYQGELGLVLDVDASAQAAEQQRREQALAER